MSYIPVHGQIKEPIFLQCSLEQIHKLPIIFLFRKLAQTLMHSLGYTEANYIPIHS